MINLNKISILFVVLFTTFFPTKAQNNMESSKILVAYFSATGTTAKVAQNIANISKGDIYEIIPEIAYTNNDLNWRNSKSRSSLEMNNPQSRPALKDNNNNIKDYNIIFIGYPIWWDEAPRIINTFIESHCLENKIIIPFATSGSSGIENSVNVLRKSYPNLNFKDGKLLNNIRNLNEWVEKQTTKAK